MNRNVSVRVTERSESTYHEMTAYAKHRNSAHISVLPESETYSLKGTLELQDQWNQGTLSL